MSHRTDRLAVSKHPLPAVTHSGASAGRPLTVADSIAESLAELGVDTVFTLLGTTNFPFTQALYAAGAQVHRARHENGAIAMTVGWAQVTGRVGVCTISKGAGLTHGLTALVESRKANTPVLVLAGDSPASAISSSPAVAQDAVVNSAGLRSERVHSPESVAVDVERAYRLAERTRQPVVLMVSSAVVKMRAADNPQPRPLSAIPFPPAPSAAAVAAAVDQMAEAKAPVLLAGRGVLVAGAEDDVRALGRRLGARLTTSVLAHGLFAGEPGALGISGGYATGDAVEQLAQADIVLALGASLNDWTMRAGAMFPNARLVHVDVDPVALGRHYPVDLAIQADAGETARALMRELDARGVPPVEISAPVPAVAETAAEGASVHVGEEVRIRPEALTTLLDRMLPPNRAVVTDGGGFLTHSIRLQPGDARAWVFALTYMSIGLGLPAGIGAAVARPDRVTVITVGDGSLLSAFADLETLARSGLPIVLVVYNDSAHGGEVALFEKQAIDASLLKFPEFDAAAVARGAGIEAATIRSDRDLVAALDDWLDRRDGPLLLDAKVASNLSSDDIYAVPPDWSVQLMKKQGL